MRSLNWDELVQHLADRGLKVSEDRQIDFAAPGSTIFEMVLRGRQVEEYLALANQLLSPRFGQSFKGALLWIKARGVWPDFYEDTSDRLYALLLQGAGLPDDPDDLLGLLFEPHELYEMHAFVSVPLFFGWDAYVVLEAEDYLVFIDRDSEVRVICRDQQTCDKLLVEVKHWNPKVLRRSSGHQNSQSI